MYSVLSVCMYKYVFSVVCLLMCEHVSIAHIIDENQV